MSTSEHKIHQSTIKSRDECKNKKCILITGVTGKQGGGVCEYLSKSNCFTLKGISRSTTDSKAEIFRKRFPNVELVQADLNVRDSLAPIFKGVDYAYLVTDYGATRSEQMEYAAGKNFLDVCKETNVKHVVYSGLPSATALSKGLLTSGIKVPHFDGKGHLEEYLRSLNINFTVVQYAFYWENFLSMAKPKRDGERFLLTLPLADKPLGGVCVTDGGSVVARIFENVDSYRGSVISICSEILTGDQMAKTMSIYCGRNVEYRPMSLDEFGKIDADMGEMFRFFQEYGSKIWTPMPGLQSFDSWCKEHSQELSQNI